MKPDDFPPEWREPPIVPAELTQAERLEWVMEKLARGETPWPEPAADHAGTPAGPENQLARDLARVQRSASALQRQAGLLSETSDVSTPKETPGPSFPPLPGWTDWWGGRK